MIVLGDGQSAEPNECGSCKYFDRCGDVSMNASGICKFVFPPHVATTGSETREYDPRYQRDTSTCSLYVSANQQYSRRRVWNA